MFGYVGFFDLASGSLGVGTGLLFCAGVLLLLVFFAGRHTTILERKIRSRVEEIRRACGQEEHA